MNLKNNYISKGIIVFITIMLVSSCAGLNRFSARSLHYSYIHKRGDSYWALQKANCEKAESEMLEAVKISKRIREMMPEEKSAGSHLAEAYKLLGHIYSDDNCKRYPEALVAYNKSLELREYIFGLDDPLYAHALNDLAWGYYYKLNKYLPAETMLLRAKAIYEADGESERYLVITFTNLGKVYQALGRYDESDKMFRKMIEHVNNLVLCRELTSELASSQLNVYASALREQGRIQESVAIEKQAKAYNERACWGGEFSYVKLPIACSGSVQIDLQCPNLLFPDNNLEELSNKTAEIKTPYRNGYRVVGLLNLNNAYGGRAILHKDSMLSETLRNDVSAIFKKYGYELSGQTNTSLVSIVARFTDVNVSTSTKHWYDLKAKTEANINIRIEMVDTDAKVLWSKKYKGYSSLKVIYMKLIDNEQILSSAYCEALQELAKDVSSGEFTAHVP